MLAKLKKKLLSYGLENVVQDPQSNSHPIPTNTVWVLSRYAFNQRKNADAEYRMQLFEPIFRPPNNFTALGFIITIVNIISRLWPCNADWLYTVLNNIMVSGPPPLNYIIIATHMIIGTWWAGSHSYEKYDHFQFPFTTGHMNWPHPIDLYVYVICNAFNTGD